MLTKTPRKDGSICHKYQNGDFDCSGSLPSTVMAIPQIDSSEETIFKWKNLPVLIHSSGKTRFHLKSYCHGKLIHISFLKNSPIDDWMSFPVKQSSSFLRIKGLSNKG